MKQITASLFFSVFGILFFACGSSDTPSQPTTQESPSITSFVIPSKDKAGITEDISADIDETNLTITLVINIPTTTDKTPLANLTPTITSPSSTVDGTLPTDYSQNTERDLTIKHANGKTKTYKLKVIFASFYVKLGDVGTGINKADIKSYDIELYTPKYKGLTNPRFPNYGGYKDEDITLKLDTTITSISLAYGIGTYVKSSDDAHIVVYGKNAKGDTLVALYAQSRTSATGKGTTLSINAIPDDQCLVIAHVNSEAWTENNWKSLFGVDQTRARDRYLEISRSGDNSSYNTIQKVTTAYEKNNYYQIVLTPLRSGNVTISQVSTIRALHPFIDLPNNKWVDAPLNMKSYRVAKPPELVFSL